MGRKIFVGGLNRSTTERTLQNTFQRFGAIHDVKVVGEHGKSKGYAFITFRDEMAADVAMSQMSGCQIDGKVIHINQAIARSDEESHALVQAGHAGAFSDKHYHDGPHSISDRFNNNSNRTNSRSNPRQQRSAGSRDRGESKNARPQTQGRNNRKSSPQERIYVGGMDWNTTEESIRKAFEAFGDIDDIKIVCDKDTGQSKGFGFITFLDSISAETAISQMNGQPIDGRAIKVSRAQYRNQKNTRNRGDKNPKDSPQR